MRSPRTPRLAVLTAVAVLLGGCSLLGGGDESRTAPSGSTVRDRLPLADVDRTSLREVRDGGTLRLTTDTIPANLNPVQVDGLQGDAEALLAPTTGGAVRLDDDGGWRVDRDYARSVEVVDKDPLTVEVRLNPKAVWQGGSPITSRDMVAYARTMSGADEDFEVGSSDGWDDVDEVERQGDDAYRVVFDEPRSDWPRFVYPRLPRNVSSDPRLFNDGFTRRAVSSNGPFVVQRVDRRTGTVDLARNPRWWGDEPRLERIRWRLAAPDVALKALGAGEVDAAPVTERTAADVPDDDVVVRRSASTRFSQLTFNAGRGVLRDLRVRDALALAVDRAAIARAQGRALGVPARTTDSVLVAPGQPGSATTSATREAAREPGRLLEARRVLEEAGWTVGKRTTKDGKRLRLVLPVPADDPVVADRAAVVRRSLAKIGAEVTVRTVPADRYYSSVLLPLDFDLVLLTWNASPLGVGPAEGRFRPVDSPINFTGITSGRPDAWEKAVRELDLRRRIAATTRLEVRWLLGAKVAVPLVGQPRVVAVSTRVANYGVRAAAPLDWTRVGLRRD
ncbi:MAG: ABC transporter substrate-binding protein [Aeromicrobium erythreum]